MRRGLETPTLNEAAYSVGGDAGFNTALNAARILGRVFARQEVMFRRDRYTAFMPRTWRHLERDLEAIGSA